MCTKYEFSVLFMTWLAGEEVTGPYPHHGACHHTLQQGGGSCTSCTSGRNGRERTCTDFLLGYLNSLQILTMPTWGPAGPWADCLTGRQPVLPSDDSPGLWRLHFCWCIRDFH